MVWRALQRILRPCKAANRQSPHDEARSILLPLAVAQRAQKDGVGHRIEGGGKCENEHEEDGEGKVLCDFVHDRVLSLLQHVNQSGSQGGQEDRGDVLSRSGPSTVPGAGTGLFAGSRGAEAGECIALFGGHVFVPPPLGVEALSVGFGSESLVVDGTGGTRSGKELMRSDGVRIDPGKDCAWLPGSWASGALVNNGDLHVGNGQVADGGQGGMRDLGDEAGQEPEPRWRSSANVVPADVCCNTVLQHAADRDRAAIASLLSSAFPAHVPWYVDADSLKMVAPPTFDGGDGSAFGAALIATRKIEPGEEIFLDYRCDAMARDEGREVHGSLVT